MEALQETAAGTANQVFEALRRYKNSEVLRIGMRNILGQANLWATTTELSDLAEGILQAMYACISTELQNEYGKPLEKAGNQRDVSSTDKKTDADLACGKVCRNRHGKIRWTRTQFQCGSRSDACLFC